jgi:branched-chain amino acid transport system permease protein
VYGPVLGAIVASLLPEIFRSTGRFQDIAYSAVLLLMLIFVPKGLSALAGLVRSRRAKGEG